MVYIINLTVWIVRLKPTSLSNIYGISPEHWCRQIKDVVLVISSSGLFPWAKQMCKVVVLICCAKLDSYFRRSFSHADVAVPNKGAQISSGFVSLLVDADVLECFTGAWSWITKTRVPIDQEGWDWDGSRIFCPTWREWWCWDTPTSGYRGRRWNTATLYTTWVVVSPPMDNMIFLDYPNYGKGVHQKWTVGKQSTWMNMTSLVPRWSPTVLCRIVWKEDPIRDLGCAESWHYTRSGREKHFYMRVSVWLCCILTSWLRLTPNLVVFYHSNERQPANASWWACFWGWVEKPWANTTILDPHPLLAGGLRFSSPHIFWMFCNHPPVTFLHHSPACQTPFFFARSL